MTETAQLSQPDDREPLQETDVQFAERVAPDLARLERIRLESYREFLHGCRIMAIPSIFVLAGVYILLFSNIVFPRFSLYGLSITSGLITGFGIFVWLMVLRPLDVYACNYKEKMLPQIARMVGLANYHLSGAVILADIQAAKIMPQFDSDFSTDYFRGTYKGAVVQFAQALMKKKTDHGGMGQDEVPVFEGLLLLVEMPKGRFYGTTVVLRSHHRLEEWVKERKMGLEKADLVDPEFEKKYTVYTSDQVEARYLLDPTMIERVNGLASVFSAKDTKVSYYNNKVLVMLSRNRNLFRAPPIFRSAKDVQSILALKHQVKLVLDLVTRVDEFLASDNKNASL